MTFRSALLEILEERLHVYDARPLLIRYQRILVASIESGTRRQRRLSLQLLKRQLKILQHGHPGSALAELGSMVPDDCPQPHRRLLELASTVERRLVSALSLSICWFSGWDHLSHISSGGTSTQFRQHIEAITSRLAACKLFVGQQLLPFGVIHSGFFSAAKVDGRNIP